MVHRVPDCGFAAAYVIEEEQGLLVVDVGSFGASSIIQKFITGTLGRRIDEIQFICATHFHIDHITGISFLLEKCPATTKVIFHRKVKEYLDGTSALAPMRNWATGLIPAALSSGKYALNPLNWSLGLNGIPFPLLNRFKCICYQDRILYPGGTGETRYPSGFGTWEIIETPGHTEDSISFYNESTGDLICGDLILNFEKNGKGKLNRFHWNAAVLMDTFLKLKNDISPAKIHPGHGELISSSGNALLDVEPI